MNISITGGTGFIGKNLVAKLSKSNLYIKILTRNHKNNTTNFRLSFLNADILKNEPLDQLFEECDVFIHCAAEIKIEALMYETNVEGTKKLLNYAKKKFLISGKKIHWIQLSSVGAYGIKLNQAGKQRNIDEETQLLPENIYEITKTISDNLVIEAANEGYITYTILRPSIIFGTEMPNNSLRELIKIIKRGLFFYIGNGNAISNYIHVDDVTDAIVLCVTNKDAKGEIFNISNDCPQKKLINSIADFAGVRRPKLRINELIITLIIEIFGKFIKTPLTVSRIKALSLENNYNIDKINKKLGFKPKIDICEKIIEFI